MLKVDVEVKLLAVLLEERAILGREWHFRAADKVQVSKMSRLLPNVLVKRCAMRIQTR